MALVAAVVRCSGTPNQMWPISMTPNSCVAALHRWRRRRAEARRASRASARGRAVQPASSRVERREGAQWARPGLKHTSISPLNALKRSNRGRADPHPPTGTSERMRVGRSCLGSRLFRVGGHGRGQLPGLAPASASRPPDPSGRSGPRVSSCQLATGCCYVQTADRGLGRAYEHKLEADGRSWYHGRADLVGAA